MTKEIRRKSIQEQPKTAQNRAVMNVAQSIRDALDKHKTIRASKFQEDSDSDLTESDIDSDEMSD